MRRLLLFAGLFVCISSRADDGVFFAMGNTLVPLQETTVQLKREVLNLTRQSGRLEVDIYFEFFNPGDEKELLVGFVTPPAEGDVYEEETKHPQIDNFTVMVNGIVQQYKITRLGKSGFKLKSMTDETGDDFVYHFTVKFKKGITVIHHSYLYSGGGSSDGVQSFLYRLSTGATWANHAIGDFELNIDMGPDEVFAVPYSFNDNGNADWKIIGIGKLGRARLKDYDEDMNERMVFIRNGTLQLKEKNFRPVTDLGLMTYFMNREISFWCEPEDKNDFSELTDFFDPDTAAVRMVHFTDRELRLYRNLNYARKGYDFKDPDLKKMFSKYIWYIPDPNCTIKEFPDYYFNETIEKMLEEEEKKRVGKQ